VLKQDYYCGIEGRPSPPNSSAKAFIIDGPSSIKAVNPVKLQPGNPNGPDIYRPSTVGLMRRRAKLLYDEGLAGEALTTSFVSANLALLNMGRRWLETGESRRGGRSDPRRSREFFRCIRLLVASERVLRASRPSFHPDSLMHGAMKEEILHTLQTYTNEISLEDARELFATLMAEEPDPLSINVVWDL
jgi:hypothetical protein